MDSEMYLDSCGRPVKKSQLMKLGPRKIPAVTTTKQKNSRTNSTTANDTTTMSTSKRAPISTSHEMGAFATDNPTTGLSPSRFRKSHNVGRLAAQLKTGATSGCVVFCQKGVDVATYDREQHILREGEAMRRALGEAASRLSQNQLASPHNESEFEMTEVGKFRRAALSLGDEPRNPQEVDWSFVNRSGNVGVKVPSLTQATETEPSFPTSKAEPKGKRAGLLVDRFLSIERDKRRQEQLWDFNRVPQKKPVQLSTLFGMVTDNRADSLEKIRQTMKRPVKEEIAKNVEILEKELFKHELAKVLPAGAGGDYNKMSRREKQLLEREEDLDEDIKELEMRERAYAVYDKRHKGKKHVVGVPGSDGKQSQSRPLPIIGDRSAVLTPDAVGGIAPSPSPTQLFRAHSELSSVPRSHEEISKREKIGRPRPSDQFMGTVPRNKVGLYTRQLLQRKEADERNMAIAFQEAMRKMNLQ